jgi:hypothetical protein
MEEEDGESTPQQRSFRIEGERMLIVAQEGFDVRIIADQPKLTPQNCRTTPYVCQAR